MNKWEVKKRSDPIFKKIKQVVLFNTTFINTVIKRIQFTFKSKNISFSTIL